VLSSTSVGQTILGLGVLQRGEEASTASSDDASSTTIRSESSGNESSNA
jgi:hypothetical protein